MLNADKIVKRTITFLFITSLSLSLFTSIARAGSDKEYETFDGRVYNGKYYPRVDIIEWTEPEFSNSHMEFQNYDYKKVPISAAYQLDDKTGRKVMKVHYELKRQNGEIEHVCRRVIAPGHFGENFYVYQDMSDPDRDIAMVSMEPLPEKKGRSLVQTKKYTPCEDEAVKTSKRLPAAAQAASSEKSSSQDSLKVESEGSVQKKDAEGKETSPFQDW